MFGANMPDTNPSVSPSNIASSDPLEAQSPQPMSSTLTTQEEIIALIMRGNLEPQKAVELYPENKEIIHAAYLIQPAVITKVSREVINSLGRENRIQIQDVLNAFSAGKRPTVSELENTRAEFDLALKENNWGQLGKICQKFWFEIPKSATYEAISIQLTKNGEWEKLKNWEKHINPQGQELVAGPLNKSAATVQLEDLARKMLGDIPFEVNTIDGMDYFEFKDGTRYNWTDIRTNANWQHIELNDADMTAYQLFMTEKNTQYCSLSSSSYQEYLDQLYPDGQPQPDPPMSFSEMQAINIYTGGFYGSMNGLMRDEKTKFDVQVEPPNKTRAALVHSVMCASGLRKSPSVTLETAYRYASYGSDVEQANRIKAAVTGGVVQLDGFVSTGVELVGAFNNKPIKFTFNNLRGMYIAPISQLPDEQEFLMPPTPIKITRHEQNPGGKHYFEASTVSPVSNVTEELIPLEIPDDSSKASLTPSDAQALTSLISTYKPKNFLQRIFTNKSDLQILKEKLESQKSDLQGPINNIIQYRKLELIEKQLNILNEMETELSSTPRRGILGFFSRVFTNPLRSNLAAALDKLQKGTIAPNEANTETPEAPIEAPIQASTAEDTPQLTSFNTEEDVILNIKAGKINPEVAVKHYPNNKEIVHAAYLKQPSVLQYASLECINSLGRANRIEIQEVLNAFSKEMPTPEEIENTNILAQDAYAQAIQDKNWEPFKLAIQKFWFEQSELLTKENVADVLASQGEWEDLARFEKAMNNGDELLVKGPLNRSEATLQLEELARKMMAGVTFKVETVDDVHYFQFTDGTRYNWTDIRTNANWQHIELNTQDMAAYQLFMKNGSSQQSSLDPSEESEYIDMLYPDKSQRPDPPMSFSEMQAINIYTGNFFSDMNGLMRNEKQKLDVQFTPPDEIQSALVHSVMCASGLRKAPKVTLDAAYRHASFGTDEEHRKRVTAAATGGVVKLDGFVSASAAFVPTFQAKPVHFKFTNLRGIYIAPIANLPHEQEFLMPPTSIQITHYEQQGPDSHYFEASQVSDLAPTLAEQFEPLELIVEQPAVESEVTAALEQVAESSDLPVDTITDPLPPLPTADFKSYLQEAKRESNISKFKEMKTSLSELTQDKEGEENKESYDDVPLPPTPQA